MSSSPRSSNVRLFGSRTKRDTNEYTNLLAMGNSRLLTHNEQPDLNESKIHFLENQVVFQYQAYRTWHRVSVGGNCLTLICVILVLVFCFHWITKIDQNEISCVNLKSTMIWVSVVYIIGAFGNILGFIAGYLKSTIGFIIYQVLIVALIILRIILDTSTINMAIKYLEGCANTKTAISINDYMYGTIVYCVLLLLVFSCNIYIIYLIWKLKEAQKLTRESS